ncbi:AsmA family protein [Neorhizobium petrolearium]|uniref:AsmA family protein n=1 Tax=Neorhizobium petrolearium TaxID=515361 RepID=A0ABY8M7K2_9HYPH|nr:AsmA family protein [Neorhizobium petrolearium]MCC2610372.1 AsmA family protein [Neorhizobium petrolearium]WGI70518.1 AsmA family protein [Neorhizobium petrolearium]
MFGRILLALSGLVVVALFTALLAPFFVDWSSFRVGFEEQASRILGKKVSVHGAVDARILPFPSVTLHDVRVGMDTDGQPLVQVARFSMDMELAPFLSGEARIFDMRIEEPRARIRLLKDGTLDWMRGSQAAIPTRVVVIEDVHVTGGEIDLVDEQSGRSRRITGLSGDFSAVSLRGPWRGEGDATLDGYAARFNLSSGAADTDARRLPLRLRLWPDAQPVEVNLDGELSLADGKPNYNGNFTLDLLQEEDDTEPVEAPPPGPRVKGGFELTNERIRIPQYRVEIGAADNPYVVTGEATLDTGEKPEFLLTAEGQQIDVNRLGEGGRAKTGRDPAVSAQRRINNFIRMAASIPIPQVPGRASLRLPAIVANDTTIRDIKLDIRPAGRGWAVDNVVATLPGRTQLEAKGSLLLRDRVSFVGDMLVASNQPSGLADWLSGRVAPEIRQLRSAGFSARVNLTPEMQRFDSLELAIGAATLKGRLERQSPQAQAPNLSVSLAGNEIDIDAMRALASLLTGDDAGQDVLDHHIAATLRADRFTAFGVAADNVDTAFTMAGGVFSLERLVVGNIEGATISAVGKVEGSLLSYAGSGTLNFRSDDPTAFLTMLRDRLPPHPALQRLARNASWFANADLSADLKVGGNVAGVEIALKGKSNGSEVNADLMLPGLFDLTGSDDMMLNVSLDNPDSRILLGQAGLDPLPFDGDGAGRLALNLRQSSADRADADLSFRTGRTTFEMRGDLNIHNEGFGEGAGHVTLKSDDLEPYLLMNGIGLPQFGTGLPVMLEADVSMTPDALQVAGLRGTSAGNDFTGDIAIDRKAPGMPATGSLDIDTLDLAWLGEAVFGPVSDPRNGAFSSKPLSRPIFGDLDAALDLRAKAFRTDGFGSITDFSARITHRAGGVIIENGVGNWQGGKLAGRMMMSNGDGNGLLQVQLAAENTDLALLVWKAGGKPVASGQLDFDISAESTGKTVAELLDAVSGSAELRLKGLGVAGINPDALKPLMAAADKLGGEVTEEKIRPLVAGLVHQGRAEIGDLTIPVTITAGEARAQNISAAVGTTKLSGEGRFDLLEDGMTADLAVTYDAGEEGLAGGDPTVRLDYSGDLAKPTQHIDVGAMTNFLSQRAFEQERRRVEALQASVLEKQRLRREVALYNFQAAERQAAREKAEAEEKARREAEEAERQRQAQAAAAAARAAEEERQRQIGQPQLIVPPTDNILRQEPPVIPPADVPGLPGVQR